MPVLLVNNNAFSLYSLPPVLVKEVGQIGYHFSSEEQQSYFSVQSSLEDGALQLR